MLVRYNLQFHLRHNNSSEFHGQIILEFHSLCDCYNQGFAKDEEFLCWISRSSTFFLMWAMFQSYTSMTLMLSLWFISHLIFLFLWFLLSLNFIENKSIFEEIVIVHLNFGFVDFSDFSHKLCSVLNLKMFYNELILGFS